VSRLQFHRWAVIFLVVSKLIFGEFTHAMPHMAAPAAGMNEIAVPAGQDGQPCADHEQASSPESDSSHDSNTDEPAEKSCCESGGCVCPCLHSPAAASAVLFNMQRANNDQLAALVEGAAWHRLSVLFRPPA
jgi:hypothetical protein